MKWAQIICFNYFYVINKTFIKFLLYIGTDLLWHHNNPLPLIPFGPNRLFRVIDSENIEAKDTEGEGS